MQTRMMQIHMQKTAIDLYNQADPKADDIGRPDSCKVSARFVQGQHTALVRLSVSI